MLGILQCQSSSRVEIRKNSLDFIAFLSEKKVSIKVYENYQYNGNIDNILRGNVSREHQKRIKETVNAVKAIIDKIKL